MKQVWKHLISSLYIKPPDCHQYLHYATGNLEHIELSRICREILKLKHLCSQNEVFKTIIFKWIYGFRKDST